MTKRVLPLLFACLLVVGAGGTAFAATGGPDDVASDAASGPASAAVAGGEPTDAESTNDATTTANRGSLRLVEFSYSPEKPIKGEPATFTVTAENDGEVPVKFDAARVVNKSRPHKYYERTVFGETTDYRVLEPGDRITVEFEATWEKTGQKRLYVNVSGTTRIEGADENHTVGDARRLNLEVRDKPEADPLIEIRGDRLVTNGSGTVTVDVTNTGDAAMKNVELRLSGAVSIEDARRVVRRIPANATETLEFDVSSDEPGAKQVRAAIKYDVANGGSGRASARTQIQYKKPETAELTIARKKFEERDDGTVYIDGSIANVGSADASGVLITVLDTEHVTPENPQPEYPVGELLTDDAPKTFELYASVDRNASGIPVRITYMSNGVEKSRKVTLDYQPPAEETGADTSGGQSGGGGPTTLIGLVVAGAVAALILYAWRNSSDDDGDDGEAPVSGDSGDSMDALAPPEDGDAGGPPAPAGGPTAQPGTPQGGAVQGQHAGAGGANQPQQGTHHARPAGGAPQQPQHGAGHAGPPQGAPGQPQGATGQQGQARGGARNQQAHAGGSAPTHSTDGGTQSGGPTAGGPGGHAPAGEPCDGCGEPRDPDALSAIAVASDRNARVCSDCKRRALAAAKRHLGASRDHDRPDVEGVDGLVAAMSTDVTCDGCGDHVPHDDLQRMELPDGSSSFSCSSCRKAAIAAARHELSGGG